MALTLNFRREPIDGGDFDTYHDYVMQLVRCGGEGALSCELYNNSGALYLSKGFFGINNGTNRGTVECTEEGEIDKSLLTDNLWAAIEASVSGAAVTISIASIVGANDESTIPAAIKAAYDYSKQAYMYTATKRLLGIVFIRTGNVLGRIVNCESGKFGFKNIKYIDYVDSLGTQSKKYVAEIRIDNPAWDMDTLIQLDVTLPFAIPLNQRISLNMMVSSNNGVVVAPINRFENTNISDGGWFGGTTASIVSIIRKTGGQFDDAAFNAALTRMIIEYET